MAEALLIGATLASGALGAVGKLQEGNERARSQLFEAQELERQAEEAKIAGAQAETDRRNELTSNLETIAAIRGARGVGFASPTGLAILEGISKDAGRDIRTERLAYRTQSDTAKRTAYLRRRQSKSSLLAGRIGAGTTFLGSVAKVAS